MSEFEFDRFGLLKEIQDQFGLKWTGTHGFWHWARVRHHGLTLVKRHGGNAVIVELFAYIHDSRRIDEYEDEDHGARGADYAAKLNGKYFKLASDDMRTLCEAIEFHNHGRTHDTEIIQTCWDADRLDLGRVGIVPHAKYLSKNAVPMIESAQKLFKSRSETIPVVPEMLRLFLRDNRE